VCGILAFLFFVVCIICVVCLFVVFVRMSEIRTKTIPNKQAQEKNQTGKSKSKTRKKYAKHQISGKKK